MINYHPGALAEFLIQHFLIDDGHSARHCSYHSDCLCRVLDKWPTSTTKSPSGTQKVPFDRKSSFNAEHTRMGDVCEVGTRIQSVMKRDSGLSLHLTLLRRFRYCSCQRFRDIDYYLKLVQSRHRPSRTKIQYLLQQVSGFKYHFPRRTYGSRSLLQLDHTIPCSTNCKLFISYFKDNVKLI